MEQNENKSKTEKQDRDLRIMQAESEAERTRGLLQAKESRVEELEKQHQADRATVHELKVQLDNAERSIIDAKTNLELEQAQRRRLESRLRAATAELSKTTMEGGGTPQQHLHSPIHNNSSSPGNDHSTAVRSSSANISQRTRILYEDRDTDERDSIYLCIFK
jgi:hypothetical protein